MARIQSLAILASNAGNDFLAEQYGVVIDNIIKGTISSQLKNKDLSGDPTTGTVEAKRFCNSKANPYGTARAGGKGDKVKAKPVTVAIDRNDEIIEEVEEKDTSLYGVEGLVARRVNNHEMVMTKGLEKDFFACAAANCEVFTTAESAIEKIVEAAVQKVEKTKNEFVDGVPRELIRVILDTAPYGELSEYFDKLPNAGGYNTADGKVRTFHRVKCYDSTDLPEGVKFIVMVDGAVAQPVKTSICNAAKIPFSDAYGFGIFYYHGEKSVMPDLTLTYTDGVLKATIEAGADATHTKVSVDMLEGAKYYYKVGAASSITVPAVGAKFGSSLGFTEWNGEDEITCASGNKIAVIEVVNGFKDNTVARATAKLDVVVGA